MSENLPQKYKDNIFSNFFRKIRTLVFTKKKYEKDSAELNSYEIRENKKSKLDFIEQIKIEENEKNIDYEKRKFMDNLTENPNLLQEFSIERLEKILQYYLEENNKKRNILKKINA